MILNFIFDFLSGDIPLHELLLDLIFSLVALLLVFPVHECAHGLAAYAFGDKTAKEQGRLTLNPLAHIDPKGFLFLLILGFGWAKPVQFNPLYFKNRRLGTICTAAAGPLSNVIFAFVTSLIYGILYLAALKYGVLWLLTFSTLFAYMAIYNATFAVFNLIPFPPLDGSKIVGELLPYKQRYTYYNWERYSYIFFIVLIIVLNRLDFITYLSSALLSMFNPLIELICGGIFG